MSSENEPRIIDVSVALGHSLPLWPGSPGISTRAFKSRALGDPANASELRMDVHCGTHVDAPRHFVDEGRTVDELDLSQLTGRTFVAQVGDAVEISSADLEQSQIPPAAERVLLRTLNSSAPDLYSTPFREDYAALSPDGAAWVRDRGVRVIGIDYLSIQRFHDPPDAHEILLNAGIPIVEGLDLSCVAAGWYEMLCLPVLINGAEAAPARVALRPLSEV